MTISQRIKTEVKESHNHGEMVGMTFGILFDGTIHFVETIKGISQVLGFETEVWDVLRDTKRKGMATYAEIQRNLQNGSIIRIG